MRSLGPCRFAVITVSIAAVVAAQAGQSKPNLQCELPEVSRPPICKSSRPSVFLAALRESIKYYDTCLFNEDSYPELYAAVERYWAARKEKRVEDLGELLPEMDLEQRNYELDTEREMLQREELVAYRICALRTYEKESTVLHLVSVRVLAVIEGRCFDDAVTMGWILTEKGWRLQPREPDTWRPMVEP